MHRKSNKKGPGHISSHIYRRGSLTPPCNFHPEKLLWQPEPVKASQCGSNMERGDQGEVGWPWPLPFPSLCTLVGLCWGLMGAVALCGCSCLVVIRSSHCTTAPSHYREGQRDTRCPVSLTHTLSMCLSLYIPRLSTEKCQCFGQQQRQTGIHPCLRTLNINNTTQPSLVALYVIDISSFYCTQYEVNTCMK